jgi:hypothetical protein
MSEGSAAAAAVARAEQIKWWDALEELQNSRDVDCGLQMARECRHPDAVWLASFFPAGVAVTRERMRDVMLEQGDDPRALHLAWLAQNRLDVAPEAPLRRAAAMGYAPAQAELAAWCEEDTFEFAQLAAAQKDRRGLYMLGECYFGGTGCERDHAKACEAFREAAELNSANAQYRYGRVAFDRLDWERYYWWGRALVLGSTPATLFSDILALVPSFERGELGRILHTVAPLLDRHVFRRTDGNLSFLPSFSAEVNADLRRVIGLHDAMLRRARDAIHCWSVVALRCAVVKDVRVMIAQMAWEEVWTWSAPATIPSDEEEEEEEEER